MKYTGYKHRDIIIRNPKLLKACGISFTADLTKSCLEMLKRMQSGLKNENVWTFNGVIWLKGKGRKHHVTNEMDEIEMKLSE